MLCPGENECFCDGYGICFEEGQKGLKEWTDLLEVKKKVENEIYYLRYNDTKHVVRVNATLHGKRKELQAELQRLREDAYRRGEDPEIRALSVERV